MVQKWGKKIMAIVGIDNPASATAADIAALPADAFAGATALLDDFREPQKKYANTMRWAIWVNL